MLDCLLENPDFPAPAPVAGAVGKFLYRQPLLEQAWSAVGLLADLLFLLNGLNNIRQNRPAPAISPFETSTARPVVADCRPDRLC